MRPLRSPTSTKHCRSAGEVCDPDFGQRLPDAGYCGAADWAGRPSRRINQSCGTKASSIGQPVGRLHAVWLPRWNSMLGSLFLGWGFIVTTRSSEPEGYPFHNQRVRRAVDLGGQAGAEDDAAVLPPVSAGNEVRLWLSVLAYNLGKPVGVGCSATGD